MVNFYYKSTTNFTFHDSGYTILVKYLKSLLKILDLQNGVFSPLDGAADQCELVERSHLTPEICGSSPDIGKILSTS